MKGRRDLNESPIVADLRKVGATVEIIDREEYDLIVGFRGLNYLLEVKTDHGKMTDSQKTFQQLWRGDYCIVRDSDDALIAIGALR